MTKKKVKPFTNRTDRIVQIRQLLRQGVTVKELTEWDFSCLEVSKVKESMEQSAETRKPKNFYEKKPKNLARCVGCGGLGDKFTFVKGICMGCVCRERTNYERKGRWRV